MKLAILQLVKKKIKESKHTIAAVVFSVYIVPVLVAGILSHIIVTLSEHYSSHTESGNLNLPTICAVLLCTYLAIKEAHEHH